MQLYWALELHTEKAMAPRSSILTWKIPWTEESGRLQTMGSLRVRNDWATSLSLFTFHALEKEMATRSSILAWRIPGTEEPSGLLSMGSHRVRHNWRDLAAATAAATLEKEIHNVTWHLDGKGVWGRMDTCMCMAESFCCVPETITMLLTDYTQIQNKKLEKKERKPNNTNCLKGSSIIY